MDKNVKVRVSYTSTLEDLPMEVSRQLSFAEDSALVVGDALSAAISELSYNNSTNVDSVLKRLESILPRLDKLNDRVADCIGVLKGYQTAVNTPDPVDLEASLKEQKELLHDS